MPIPAAFALPANSEVLNVLRPVSVRITTPPTRCPSDRTADRGAARSASRIPPGGCLKPDRRAHINFRRHAEGQSRLKELVLLPLLWTCAWSEAEVAGNAAAAETAGPPWPKSNPRYLPLSALSFDLYRPEFAMPWVQKSMPASSSSVISTKYLSFAQD